MSYENEMQQIHDDYRNGKISTEEFSKRRQATMSNHNKNKHNSQPSPGMVHCSVCEKEIASSARVCPQCGAKRVSTGEGAVVGCGLLFGLLFMVLSAPISLPIIGPMSLELIKKPILILIISIVVIGVFFFMVVQDNEE